MTTLPNMSIILPTLGGDSGVWDDKINAGFGLIDAHNHTPGKGPLVPTTGLNINADLPFAGFGATGLGKTAFNAVTALTAGSKTLFVNAADNELYWRTNAGVNVKLTAGTSINTTLVGGIVGDYSTVGALVAYDDANKRYTFKTQTATWARLATGPVRIYEFNTTESVYVEHTVSAALAASYTVTWPPALPPSATSIMTVTTAGVVAFADELANAYFSSSQRVAVPPSDWFQPAATHTPSHNTYILAASADYVWAPIRLPVGAVVHRVYVRAQKNTSGADTIGATVRRSLNGVDSAPPEGGVSLSDASNAPGDIVMDSGDLFGGTGFAIGATYSYHVRLEPSGSIVPAADRFFLVEYEWNFPAP